MTRDIVVAIHQPNLFPWLGFFHKLASSDVFILLDTVKFSRGQRINRTEILADGKATRLTAPVRRVEHGEPVIADAVIDDSRPWRRKAMRTVDLAYRGAPGFVETVELVEPTLFDETSRLATLNERGIRRIKDALGIARPRLVRATDIDVEGAGSDLLARLVEAVGGTTYLSGAGAGGYLEEGPFRRRGIHVQIQRFEHPDYPQRSPEALRGLSVIDAMMSLGPTETGRLLR
jgi:hypothetical protein